MSHPLLIVSQSDPLIQIVDINSHTECQTVQKPTDLDLHCLQKQGISGFSRTSVKSLHLFNFMYWLTIFKIKMIRHPAKSFTIRAQLFKANDIVS